MLQLFKLIPTYKPNSEARNEYLLASKRHVSKTNARRQLKSFLKCLTVSHPMPPMIFSLLRWKMRFALVHRYPESSFVVSSLRCPWAS